MQIGIMVALRKESVDRNVHAHIMYIAFGVALRKESVDRNWYSSKIIMSVLVALRKESVDRNGNHAGVDLALGASLSARRAWIEILTTVLH